MKSFFFFVMFSPLLTSSLYGSFADSGKNFVGYHSGGAIWGDFNNSGFYDLIAFGQTTQGARLHRYNNNSGDIINNQSLATFIDAVTSGEIIAADISGNGILDVAITGHPGVLKIYEGRGDGLFDEVFSGSQFQYSSLAWVDIDADGDLDLFVTGHDSGRGAWKSVVVSNNDGVFTEVELSIPGFQDGSAAFADYNQNGWPDLAVTGATYYIFVDGVPFVPGPPRSIVYKNLGYGEFEEAFVLPPLENASIAWFDYNADGYIDLFISGKEEGQIPEERVYVYKNSGPPNYNLEEVAWHPGAERGKIICGDINNNGYGDFFVVGSTSGADGALARVYAYDNVSDSFLLEQELPGLGRAAAAFYDYNKNGKIDLFYSGRDPATEYAKSYLYNNQTADSNSPPAVPGNASASVSDGYLVLQWDAPADDNTPPAALNYSLRVGTISFSSNTISGSLSTPFLGYNPPAKLSGNPGINLAGIREGVTYFWAVRALDAAFAAGGWTEEQAVFVAGVPPSAVSNLTALPGSIDGAISLSWTAPGNDGTFGRCTSYDVRYSSTANTISTESDFDSATKWLQNWAPRQGGFAEARTLTGLRPGTTYYFGIRASDGFSYGSWATGAAVNSQRDAPAQNIVPSSPTWRTNNYLQPGDSRINLRWNLNTEIDISSYTVEMSTPGGSFEHLLSTAHPVNSLLVMDLENFTTYQFRIRASDWTNYISTWSEVKSNYPFDTTPPATITTLQAARADGVEVSLFWTATGDSDWEGDIVAGKYRIAYATYSVASDTTTFTENQMVEFSTNTSPGAAESFLVPGLAHDTTYYFGLMLADEVPNWSNISNEAYVKTKDTVPPAAVTSLAGYEGIEAGVIDLSWFSPGDNDWEGILTGHFRIDYGTNSFSLSSETVKKTVSAPGLAPGTEVQAPVTGLLAGASYYFRIWSFDEEDNSSYASNIATATAQADTNPPDVSILIPVPVSSSSLKSYGKLDYISGTAVDDYGFVAEVSISTGSISGPWHFAVITGDSWSFACSTFSFTSGLTHTILAKAKDSYGNETSTYTVGISSVSFFYDALPPDEVSDLSASTGSLSGVIELTWRAPADNPASDTVGGYIIKYASYTLADTTAWWEQAAEISPPLPLAPGTTQGLSVTGLPEGVTHWFAIKSYDGVDYYNSTSAVSNIAFCMARYGPATVTKFRINVSSPVVKGVPLGFSVSCHNPHYENIPATAALVNVTFSGAGAEFYPSSYDFTDDDGGTKTFSKAIIFTDFGDRVFQVTSGDITAYSSPVRVSSSPASAVGIAGGTVAASDDMKLVIPAGALSSNRTLRLDILTDSSEIPAYAGSTIAASACEIVNLAGGDIVFKSAATLTLAYLDNNDDGVEDKTGLGENSLGLFFHDGKAWRLLSDSPGPSALHGAPSASSLAIGNVFAAKVYRSGKYAIFPLEGLSRSISGVKPKRKIITPYAAGSNDFIEFTGAQEPFTLSVYSASGKKVFEGQNSYTWAGETTGGAKVPGGIYFYEMVSPAGTITGAVVVAR